MASTRKKYRRKKRSIASKVTNTRKTRRKVRQRKLTTPEVVKIFNRMLSPKKIYQIVKSKAMNLSIYLAAYTGDNMYPKITSVLQDQSRGNGVKQGRTDLPAFAKTLDPNDLVFGSLLNISKSAPSPKFKINPYVKLTSNGRIHKDEATKQTVDTLHKYLTGRVINNNDEE